MQETNLNFLSMSNLTEMFSKVYNDDKTKVFRLKTEWEDTYFRLFITENKKSWFSLVTQDHLEMLAKQHEIDFDVYFNTVRKFISKDAPSISFDIVKNQFIIYRSMDEENFRFKYFFVKLEELNYQETVESFIDDLVIKYTQSLNKLQKSDGEKLQAKTELEQYQNKCKEFIELKKQSDLKMYSAFALVLNEKKHHIRFLTELLNEYQTDGKSKFNTKISNTVKSKSKKAVKNVPEVSTPIPSTSKEKERISNSESNHSDDYNTDDEKNSKLIDREASPGTSRKDDLDFLGGDSPPPPVVPKRLKINPTKSEEVAEEFPIPEGKCKKTDHQEEFPMEIEETNSEQGSEMLELNTQELLDRM